MGHVRSQPTGHSCLIFRRNVYVCQTFAEDSQSHQHWNNPVKANVEPPKWKTSSHFWASAAGCGHNLVIKDLDKFTMFMNFMGYIPTFCWRYNVCVFLSLHITPFLVGSKAAKAVAGKVKCPFGEIPSIFRRKYHYLHTHRLPTRQNNYLAKDLNTSDLNFKRV